MADRKRLTEALGCRANGPKPLCAECPYHKFTGQFYVCDSERIALDAYRFLMPMKPHIPAAEFPFSKRQGYCGDCGAVIRITKAKKETIRKEVRCMICPCKICEEKGCGKKHDSCDAYRKWSAERTEINRRKKMETEQSQLSRQQEVRHWRNLKQGRTVSMR